MKIGDTVYAIYNAYDTTKHKFVPYYRRMTLEKVTYSHLYFRFYSEAYHTPMLWEFRIGGYKLNAMYFCKKLPKNWRQIAKNLKAEANL